MRKYRLYTDSDVINYSKQVKSISGLLAKLGIKPVGGNYRNIKRILQRLNINTAHWTGQGWNKGQQLKDWSQYTRSNRIKSHLIKLRGHICDVCKLSNWLDHPISLELHHIDGNSTNNNLENLQLLCCNCHSFTKTWRIPKFNLTNDP